MIDICFILLSNSALANPKMYSPLGVLYLAAIVEKAGHSCQIVDFRDSYRPMPEAKIYAFSCTTPEIAEAKALSRDLRATGALRVVGGAHATLLPEDCRNDFDFVIVGEGEEAILKLFTGLAQDKTYPIWRMPRLKALDAIPYPAWDKLADPFSTTLFPGERYGRQEKAMTILASRGCPYQCAFCANMLRAPVSFRSIPNIIGELRALMERDVRHFRFEDDCFTIHPQFDTLCAEIQKLGISYKCHTRSDLMTKEKAEMMKASGCEECGLGVESADNRVLEINNKKETVLDHIKAVITLQGAGIRAKTYMIAGLPGETEASMRENRTFFEICKPAKWTLSTFTPYPGSAIFKHPEQFDIEIIDKDWAHWWNFCEDHYVHVNKGQTQEQMWKRYKDMYAWLIEGKWHDK